MPIDNMPLPVIRVLKTSEHIPNPVPFEQGEMDLSKLVMPLYEDYEYVGTDVLGVYHYRIRHTVS